MQIPGLKRAFASIPQSTRAHTRTQSRGSKSAPQNTTTTLAFCSRTDRAYNRSASTLADERKNRRARAPSSLDAFSANAATDEDDDDDDDEDKDDDDDETLASAVASTTGTAIHASGSMRSSAGISAGSY